MNKVTIPFYIFTIIIIISSLQSCIERAEERQNSLSNQDKEQIGYTVDTAICNYFNQSYTTEVLDETEYAEFYEYIYRLRDQIITTAYLDEVPKIRIIHSSVPVETAFVGIDHHIYIYTDLLKALNNEPQIVGILSMLMACDESEKAIEKLQNIFSHSYLVDLALGGKLDNTLSVLTELKEQPYDSLWVNTYDEKTISILCSENYNIQSYSDLFALQPNLQWMHLYPRPNNIAATLFNRKNTTDCNGSVDNNYDYQTMINSLP